MAIRFKTVALAALALSWVAGSEEASAAWNPGIQQPYEACKASLNTNRVKACEGFKADKKAYNTCCNGGGGFANETPCQPGPSKDPSACEAAADSASFQCNHNEITPLCK
jgi:hypothetical protein